MFTTRKTILWSECRKRNRRAVFGEYCDHFNNGDDSDDGSNVGDFCRIAAAASTEFAASSSTAAVAATRRRFHFSSRSGNNYSHLRAACT